MRGYIIALAAAVSFCGGSSTNADLINWSTSGTIGGSSGQVAAFDGSAFGTIADAGDAAFDGAGAFGASGFSASAINLFFVDFTDSAGAAASAGLTLFAIWGTSDTPSTPDLASTLIFGDPFVSQGADIDNPVPGTNEIYTWGNLSHSSLGLSSMLVQNDPTELPTGFVVTNFNFGLSGSLADALVLNFTEGQGILDWGLFSADSSAPDVTGNFTTSGEDTLILAIPAPASIFVLAGFAGMARRRRA